MAANPQQGAPGAAAGPGGAPPTDSVIAKPMAFNGDLGIYHAWKRSLHLYMAFNTSKFPDDETKVACALTYMTSGSANNWAQALYESVLDPVAGTLTLGTWADFLTELDETFNDPNAQRKAMDSLLRDKLDIDTDGPEAFFATYEINARKANLIAGTAANNAIHINNVIRLMPFDIQTCIGYMPTPATTYSTLKTTILQMYASYKERKDRLTALKATQKPKASPVGKPSPTASTSTRTQTIPRPKLTDTERERRRRERLCFICGSPDHQIKDCSLNTRDVKPKVRITVADVPVNDMTTEERTALRARIDEVDQGQQGF